MLRKTALAMVISVTVLAPGCGGRPLDPGSSDGGLSSDGKQWRLDVGGFVDARPVKPGPLLPGCVGCRDYVFSQILVPATSSDAIKYALERKGKKYNALGNILALLSSQSSTLSVPASVANSVNKGKALILMRLQADSLVNDPTVKAQLWLGAETKCCKSPNDPYQCGKEAAVNCFSGKGSFKVASSSPKDMFFSGAISNGQLTLGPGRMTLRMSMAKKSSDLPLKHARLRGSMSADMISSGVLNGAISMADLQKIVIPQIAAMLSETFNSPGIDWETKKMLSQLFDMNKDGKISVHEVADNPLIKTFLAGDVDVEPDGKTDLSLGIGYNAIGARIVN